MKRWKVAAMVLISLSALGQDAAKLHDIKAMYRQKQQALFAQYVASLESLRISFRQKGDLDSFLAVDAEKKRAEAEKTVPTLSKAGAVFRPPVETYHKSLLELSRKCIVALDDLIKREMLADDIEAAKAAKDERDALLFVIADIESAMPPSPGVGDGSGGDKQPGPQPDGKRRKAPPADAVEFNGHHYKVFAEQVDWNTAAAKCGMLGGHLVSIASLEENNFVCSMIDEYDRAWLGASKDLGSWRWWNSRERFLFQNWSSGKPSSASKPGYKGVMYRWSGKWYDVPADSPDIPAYVCEWDY